MIEKDNVMLFSRYLFARMTKRELQVLCMDKGIPKSGTKSSLIDRLVDVLSVDEILEGTKEIRQNINRFSVDSQLLELRLSLGAQLYNQLFDQSIEPLQMLAWYERLVLSILLKGPRSKSEIIDDELFNQFLDETGVDLESRKRLSERIIRWNRKSLVEHDILILDPKGWIYSINSRFYDYFRPLSGIESEHLLNLFRRTLFGKYWPRRELPRSIVTMKPVRFSTREPEISHPGQVADTIRVLAFSDWRVQKLNDIFEFLKKVETVDFILYGGDDIGRFEEGRVNYFSELSSFAKSKRVLAVIGNDDSYSTKRVLKADGVHDLYDQSYVYKNFAFVGLESSTSRPAVFRHEEKDFEKHLEHQSRVVKGKRLVVLSHAPPFGILDRGIRFADIDESTHHIGSIALRQFIETEPVDLVICGHCHSHGGRMEKLENTTIVNVSSHDSPGAKGNFAIIELTKDGTVDVEWHDTLEVLAEDSLSKIYGIGQVRAEKLIDSGVHSIREIAECEDVTEIAHSSGLSEKHLRKIQLRAKSLLDEEIYQIADFKIDSEKMIFFDIETDIACERVWLIGFQVDGVFNRLYADDWEQERSILIRFADILEERPSYTLVSYSGTNFDRRVMLQAMKRHGIDTSLLTSHPHIDISVLLRRCFIFPNQRFALKDLGSLLGYPFKHPDLDGLAVALSYHRHVEEGRALNPRIFDYNQDDVQAIPFLVSRVHSIRKPVSTLE